MFARGPRIACAVFGLFLGLALLDGAFRSGFFPVFVSVCNPGIGLGIGLPETIIWVGIVLVLMFVLREGLTRPFGAENLAWGIIFIGGVTNAIDRYAHGCVMDYVRLPFFPSFNLADMMIFLGVVTLSLFSLGVLPKAKSYVS